MMKKEILIVMETQEDGTWEHRIEFKYCSFPEAYGMLKIAEMKINEIMKKSFCQDDWPKG